MTLPRWIPRPLAWAHAAALFVFAKGVSVAMSLVLPLLGALMRHSPRLAWFGILVLWLSPIAAAASLHAVVDRAIGPGETRSTPGSGSGGATSLWMGFVAWAAIIFVTMTTAFITVIFDPPPLEGGVVWSVATVVSRGISGFELSAIWLIVAAYVYELEAAARARAGGSA